MPVCKTEQEFEQLCQSEFDRQTADYNTQLEANRERIRKHWDEHGEQLYNSMLDKAKAQIDSEFFDDNGQFRSLSDKEKEAKLDEAGKAIENELNERFQQELNDAGLGIPTPMTIEVIRRMFSHLRPQEEFHIEEAPQIDIPNAYYQIADGRTYSMAAAEYVNERSIPEGATIIKVNDDEQQFRTGIVEFYKKTYPQIRVGTCLMTLDEAKAAAIVEINQQVSKAIMDGFTYNIQGKSRSSTFHFSFDEDDQLNMHGKAIAANMANADAVITWQGWNKADHNAPDAVPTQLEFTPELFLRFYMDGAMAHLDKCLTAGREAKAKVKSATTKEQVKAVKLG